MTIQIVSYRPEYAERFRDLNIAWLEHYFYVEDKDKELLENCEISIIGKGGYIFMAEHEQTAIGCFSLIPFEEGVFELGKMAVDKNYQGHNIGQQLLSFAIDFAHQQNWIALVLYSSTKLDAALHIYKKYGFKEVTLEKNLPYERSDIKMRLNLS